MNHLLLYLQQELMNLILFEIAWQKFAEDDPIILFWRAKEI